MLTIFAKKHNLRCPIELKIHFWLTKIIETESFQKNSKDSFVVHFNQKFGRNFLMKNEHEELTQQKKKKKLLEVDYKNN